MRWLKKLRWWKKFLLVLLAFVLGYCTWNWQLVLYGIAQGRGQLRIISEARPIAEVMADPTFPDSLKTKLNLIQEIRDFAIDSIGLTDSDSYKEVYDQHGKPILWVVTACQPYALEDYKWEFPLLGALSYKGHFEEWKAEAEAAALDTLGLDTDVGEVSAWSTLGWLDDPILSNMLTKSEGELARLIIHELTHATLFVSGDVDFNENLATFVGDFGAYEFLEFKYGANSEEYSDYQGGLHDIEHYSDHILAGANRLNTLYEGYQEGWPVALKDSLKAATIQQIVRSADTIPFHNRARFKRLLAADFAPNNTFFMGYKRYRADLSHFENAFKNDFNSDFPRYVAHLIEQYQ